MRKTGENAENAEVRKGQRIMLQIILHAPPRPLQWHLPTSSRFAKIFQARGGTRGQGNIPLTFIPLPIRSALASNCSGLILLGSPLVAAPPRYVSALIGFLFMCFVYFVVKIGRASCRERV